MTVAQLKNLLRGYSDDTKVFVAEPAHDYCQRVLAVEASSMDIERATRSEHHGSLVLVERDSEPDPEDVVEQVLVLGSLR